jgi:hypothetical protein
MCELDVELFRDRRRRTAIRRLGTVNPRCANCGKENPHVLSLFQLDHIVGKKHGDETEILCLNCHAERSELQREQPPGGNGRTNFLEYLMRLLHAWGERFKMVGEQLCELANWLKELVKRGYGSDLPFPTGR